MRKPLFVALFVNAVFLGGDPSAYAQVGSCPRFRTATEIAVEASGSLVVSDGNLDAVFRVDPITGKARLGGQIVPTEWAGGIRQGERLVAPR